MLSPSSRMPTVAESVAPTSNQPRVSSKSVQSGPPRTQYRVTGIRSATPKSSNRSSKR